jgi:beta-glucanase (GH16 family)
MRFSSLPAIILLSLLLLSCVPRATTPDILPTKPIIPEPTFTATADPNSWNLVWADEFDQPNGSAPDSTKWNHQQGGSGWGNGELQHYTDTTENSFVQDGMLIIQANKEYMLGRDYTSARLTTQFKGDWTYGRYEIRAKLPNAQGIWPAFWLLPSRGVYGSGTAGGEIDIMEMIGSEPNRVYGTLHFGNPPEHASNSHVLQDGANYSDDFHVFALEWGPDEICWYVDGNLFHSATDWFTSAKNAAYPAPFDQNFYLIVNVAVGGTWPGRPDETSIFPQRMYVDYVRVYQHPE